MKSIGQQGILTRRCRSRSNDQVIKTLLSRVFKPKTQNTSPIMARSESVAKKIIQKRPKRYSPERIFKEPLKRKKSSVGSRRNLINHSNFSVANLNIKKRFERIMKNESRFELNLQNSKSRCLKAAYEAKKSKNLTTQTAAWTGFNSGDAFPTEKSTTKKLTRKMTGISRSKYTDGNISKFDFTSDSPTKTDKSFIINDINPRKGKI